jgi:hypothetical protein
MIKWNLAPENLNKMSHILMKLLRDDLATTQTQMPTKLDVAMLEL